MPERKQRPTQEDPMTRPGGDDGDGPGRPNVDQPKGRDLLNRMKRVDPRQARRYRQRSGQ